MAKGRSKVSALPGPVKAAVDELLATGRFTLDDIVARLRTMAAAGAVEPEELPSRSGLGRYAQRFEQVAGRMRLAREVAETWKQDVLKDPESDLGQALLSMVETAAFEAASQADGDSGVEAIELLGRTAKHLASARAVSTDRILKLKQKAEEEKRKAVEAERAAAAGRAAQAASEAGLSPDLVAEIKRKIAGVG